MRRVSRISVIALATCSFRQVRGAGSTHWSVGLVLASGSLLPYRCWCILGCTTVRRRVRGALRRLGGVVVLEEVRNNCSKVWLRKSGELAHQVGSRMVRLVGPHLNRYHAAAIQDKQLCTRAPVYTNLHTF